MRNENEKSFAGSGKTRRQRGDAYSLTALNQDFPYCSLYFLGDIPYILLKKSLKWL